MSECVFLLLLLLLYKLRRNDVSKVIGVAFFSAASTLNISSTCNNRYIEVATCPWTNSISRWMYRFDIVHINHCQFWHRPCPSHIFRQSNKFGCKFKMYWGNCKRMERKVASVMAATCLYITYLQSLCYFSFFFGSHVHSRVRRATVARAA